VLLWQNNQINLSKVKTMKDATQKLIKRLVTYIEVHEAQLYWGGSCTSKQIKRRQNLISDAYEHLDSFSSFRLQPGSLIKSVASITKNEYDARRCIAQVEIWLQRQGAPSHWVHRLHDEVDSN
jgi:hypothetical protein